MLDAALAIRMGGGGVRIEEVFPSMTVEGVAQVRKRVHAFESLTFRWGAEYMDLVYRRDLDEASRERAVDELRGRHDREYEAGWSDFSRASRSAGEFRGQFANR